MPPQEKKGVKTVSFKKEVKLPEEIQKNLDSIMDAMVALEKKEYHNDLVPFLQVETRMRANAKDKIFELFSWLSHGKAVLKELFETEEQKNPNLPQDVLFKRLEEAADALGPTTTSNNKSLQELYGLSQPFMNRAYEKAKNLSDEKRYGDAACVFMCLRRLNDNVFEYWIGEAMALQKLGKFQEALDAYAMGALDQPENPDIFFQMAECLCGLSEFQAAIKALKICIEFAQKEPEYAELIKVAEDIKILLEKQKAA